MKKPEIILEKLKKEENCVTRLYAALSDHQKAIESLKKEYLASQDAEHENDIDRRYTGALVTIKQTICS